MKKILITGSTGFIGKRLLQCFDLSKFKIKCAVRSNLTDLPTSFDQVVIGDFEDFDDWGKVLEGIDIVVHLVARVHVMNDASLNPLTEYRDINTNLTLRLAKTAAQNGVSRFVYLSSIKVNGEFTERNRSFRSDDQFIPTDPYGLSKYEAEQGLLALARDEKMEVVIIRPPLVYGPGVKANFASMVNLVIKGIPLPFGMVNNIRSMIALENLVDFITLCADPIRSSKAANQIFLISDGEDVSTPVLIKKIAYAFGKNPRLLNIPVSWMRLLARLIGKKDYADRLFCSLQVDSSKARDLLGWKPVITMDEQLKKIAESYD